VAGRYGDNVGESTSFKEKKKNGKKRMKNGGVKTAIPDQRTAKKGNP